MEHKDIKELENKLQKAKELRDKIRTLSEGLTHLNNKEVVSIIVSISTTKERGITCQIGNMSERVCFQNQFPDYFNKIKTKIIELITVELNSLETQFKEL